MAGLSRTVAAPNGKREQGEGRPSSRIVTWIGEAAADSPGELPSTTSNSFGSLVPNADSSIHTRNVGSLPSIGSALAGTFSGGDVGVGTPLVARPPVGAPPLRPDANPLSHVEEAAALHRSRLPDTHDFMSLHSSDNDDGNEAQHTPGASSGATTPPPPPPRDDRGVSVAAAVAAEHLEAALAAASLFFVDDLQLCVVDVEEDTTAAQQQQRSGPQEAPHPSTSDLPSFSSPFHAQQVWIASTMRLLRNGLIVFDQLLTDDAVASLAQPVRWGHSKKPLCRLKYSQVLFCGCDAPAAPLFRSPLTRDSSGSTPREGGHSDRKRSPPPSARAAPAAGGSANALDTATATTTAAARLHRVSSTVAAATLVASGSGIPSRSFLLILEEEQPDNKEASEGDARLFSTATTGTSVGSNPSAPHLLQLIVRTPSDRVAERCVRALDKFVERFTAKARAAAAGSCAPPPSPSRLRQ